MSSTASTSAAPSAPRSLADDLRGRSDERLAALLRARPDLVRPVPADMRALATRAATAPSVLRCLDRYDAFALGVAEVIAQDEAPTSAAEVVDRILLALDGAADDSSPTDSRDPQAVTARVLTTVDDLIDVGFLWGAPDALRMIRTARDALLTGHGSATDPAASLDRLRALSPPTPASAVDRDGAQVDRAAAQAALDIVRLVGALIDLWSAAPPSVLRAGGLGIRDLSRTAQELDIDGEQAAFVVELAAAAGLIADDGAADPMFAPTASADVWTECDTADRWATVAVAWWSSPRAAGLAGARDAKGQRLAVLSSDLERSAAITARREVLAALNAVGPGVAPSVDDVVTRLNWAHPRRASALRVDLVRWTLRESAWLGATGLGALSAPGRALAAHGAALTSDASAASPLDAARPDDAVALALRSVLPPPVDHVILQPDLTAVAPGPLDEAIARRIAVLADIESTGGATVYRFSEATLRRGFDAGWDAVSLREFLNEVSRTPVPQPLGYLIDDIARRHGSLRIGAASSYIRCDDPETLTALLATRLATTLHLRRLAPSIAISPVAGPVLLERLRDAGHAPALETGDGVVVITKTQPHRARPVAGSGLVRTGDEPADERLIDAAVRALRHGESSGRETVAAPPLLEPLPGRGSPARTLAALRAAIADRASLRIGYAGSDGTTLEHLLDPVSVSAGQLTAYDHRGGEVRTFSVSRITGVELLAAASPAPAPGSAASSLEIP
jgi:hypothetical protein